MPRYVDDVIIDPPEVAMVSERTPMSLSEMGIGVLEARWGDSAIAGTAVRTATGQALVGRRAQPTTVELVLEVREDAEVDLPTAAYRLQQKLGTIQEGGCWIMRVPYIGGEFAGPILYKITGVISLGNIAGWGRGEQPDVTLTLERDPVGYSTEEEESETFSTSGGARQLVYTLDPSKGTAKGMRRVEVTNEGEEDWRGLIWAEECRDAPDDLNDATAQLAYLAKNLTPRGGAEVKTVSGVECVEHSQLSLEWLTILSSEIAGVGHMTHRGPRPMWMRVYDGTDVGYVQLRLQGRALGASRWDESLPIVSTPVKGGWIPVFLGVPRPERAVVGTERWEWRLQARAPSGGGVLRIRDVYPLPSEQYIVLSESYDPPAADAQATKSPGAVTSVAEPETPGWSGTSNAQAADSKYATVSLFPGSEESLVSEVLLASGFGFEIPDDATVTAVAVVIRKHGGNVRDSSLFLYHEGVPFGKNKARAESWESFTDYPSTYLLSGADVPVETLNSPTFGVGLSVEAMAFAAANAFVDAFSVVVYWTEEESEDRVCFARRSLEIRSDGVVRQHRSDDVWGDLVPDAPFLPFDPPGGLEEKEGRGIIIPSAGDLASLPDGSTPSLNAVPFRRPGYHVAREAAS